MSGEPTLIDANILVYALLRESEHHAACRTLIEGGTAHDANLCVTSQILAEFFSVVTNPRRVSSPRTPEEASAAIHAVLSLPGLRVLPVPEDAPIRWLQLLIRRPVRGGDIFDLQIVATMLSNDVRRIVTFNRKDFLVFAELEVLTPGIS